MREFFEIKTDEEIKSLAALAFSIWHEYWVDILKPAQIDYMIDKFQSYGAINKQIDEENYKYNIIKENGENVGYFAVSIKNTPVWETNNGFNEPYLFLSKIYLVKSARGNGIGREVFKKIQEIAEKSGIKKIILTVNKNNTNTIKAYQKWGFEIIDSVVTDIGQGFIMDDYIMLYKV